MVIVQFMHPDALYSGHWSFTVWYWSIHRVIFIQCDTEVYAIILKLTHCDTDVYAELYRNLHRVTRVYKADTDIYTVLY